MTNLAIEILLLAVVLVNFGAILTANIYSKSVKEFKRNKLFCSKSFSNPYCILWAKFGLQSASLFMSEIWARYCLFTHHLAISLYFLGLINFLLIPTNKLYLMGAVAFCVAYALGALGRRFESCRPDS